MVIDDSHVHFFVGAEKKYFLSKMVQIIKNTTAK
jgi:hypothetical protein